MDEHSSIYYHQQEYRKNNIHINPMIFNSGKFWVYIQRGKVGDDDFWKSNDSDFETYEDALRAGLKIAEEELLELTFSAKVLKNCNLFRNFVTSIIG